jgi:hypothetical protein
MWEPILIGPILAGYQSLSQHRLLIPIKSCCVLPGLMIPPE